MSQVVRQAARAPDIVGPMLLLTLFGCPGDGDSATETAAEVADWQVLGENLPGAALSVWGRSDADVWVVGADPGTGPMVLHLKDGLWESLDGFGSGDLWWVHGDEAGLWTAGAGGRVFREGITSWDSWTLDESKTFYGIWGPGDGTVWAVGGNPDEPSDAATMWRYDGAQWSEVTLPPEAAARYALFKVHGTSADDVWAVGAAGAAIHWDGSAWTWVDTLSSQTLLTIDDGYAVGGTANGVILELSPGSQTWTDVSPQYAGLLAGVRGGERPVAVGTRGSVYWRNSGTWEPDERAIPTYQDLHAVWTDPDGGVWTVGGHTSSAPLIQGVVVYDGPDAPPHLR